MPKSFGAHHLNFSGKMQNNLSEQEQIRQKRLQKLMQHQQNVKQGDESGEPKVVKITISPKPLLELGKAKESQSKRATSTSSKETPTTTILSAQSTSSSPKSSKVDTSVAQQAFFSMSDSQWESQVSQSVLQVSLSSLPMLEQELISEGLPLELNSQIWERALFAKFETVSDFDYLVCCWVRAEQKLENLSRLPQQDVVKRRRLKLLDIQDLLLNYCGLLMNLDTCEMFPSTHNHGSAIFGILLARSDDVETRYPRNFIEALLCKFKNSGIDEILSTTVLAIVKEMITKPLYEKDFRLPIRALYYLISFKTIADFIITMPGWCSADVDARKAETNTILGPFFSRTSTFPDSDGQFVTKFFGTGNGIVEDLVSEHGVGGRNFGNIRATQESLQLLSLEVGKSLKDICMSFIKTSTQGKESILSYFYRMLELNRKRSRLQVNRMEVCSEGFIGNITNVSKLLVDPILDGTFSKLDLIDPLFFMYQNRIDISEETRINADLETAIGMTKTFTQAYPSHPAPNFVTEIFYLTLFAHHLGPLSSIRLFKSFTKELDAMKAELERANKIFESDAWSKMDAFTRNANEQGFKRLKSHVDQLVGIKLALEGAIMSVQGIEDSLRFYDLVMIWLVKMAVGQNSKVSWAALAAGDTCG